MTTDERAPAGGQASTDPSPPAGASTCRLCGGRLNHPWDDRPRRCLNCGASDERPRIVP